jgi:hypothetical protein
MCPLCGATTAPGQEYCLECGERLVAAPVLTGEAVAQVLPFTRATWFWPALVGLLIAGLASGFIIVGKWGHKKAAVQNITTPFITVKQTKTLTKAAATAPAVTSPAASTAPASTTPAKHATLIQWPATTTSAYTIVLLSLPSTGGRSPALAQANKALAAGLPQVGVLDSGKFATLHPGYFVVFSGIYDTQSAAQAALAQAHTDGFDVAYVRQVSR